MCTANANTMKRSEYKKHSALSDCHIILLHIPSVTQHNVSVAIHYHQLTTDNTNSSFMQLIEAFTFVAVKSLCLY